MIIKLLEQPIIAIHEAEIAGTVDGVIIKGNKVSCIYHRNMENHFAIPVENAIIGNDAVMIQDVTAMTLASQSVKPLKSMLDVYNISGRHLGCLTEIEVDDQLVARYIYTEDHKIDMSKTVNYESVIVVDVEEDELVRAEVEAEVLPKAIPEEESKTPAEDVASETEAEVSMEIGPEIKWDHGEPQQKVKSPEGSELSVVRSLHQAEDKEAIAGVDAKYAYLCGKQLLEGIQIEDIFYEKGTIIGADLIKHAISSNAIVKVIVNAED